MRNYDYFDKSEKQIPRFAKQVFDDFSHFAAKRGMTVPGEGSGRSAATRNYLYAAYGHVDDLASERSFAQKKGSEAVTF